MCHANRMHFSWLGGSTVKIQAKPLNQDVVIVIDPYKPAAGVFPRNLSPDIGLYSRGEAGSINLSGQPFILSTPGECETKGVLITTAPGHTADALVLRIDAEDISVGHLGRTNSPLSDAQLEVLSEVDVLFVPFGGEGCYDAEEAVKAVNAVEPRIVIPMAFQSDNDPTAPPVSQFLKEMGVKNGQPEKKVIVKKKDLPQEETKVIILAKE